MTGLKVGIACWLPLAPHSGAKTRLFGFLRGLARISEAQGHEWILLGNSRSPGFAQLHQLVAQIPGGQLFSVAIPESGRQRALAERRILPKVCEELQLDVLDLQSLPVPHLTQTKILTTIHDIRDRGEWRRSRIHKLLAKPLLAQALKLSARMIVPSPQVRQELKELLGEDSEKLQVVPAGLDRQELQEETRKGPQMRFFLNIGRDEARKRLEFLLRAYAWALERNPKLEMLAQVGASRRQRLDRLCRQLGIEQRIVWMGELDNASLHRVLDDSLAMIFPSALEGFGLPVLEAMTHGRPSVVAKGGPPAWLVGEGGLQLDGDSIEAFGNAMLRLSAEPEFCTSLGALAYERAAEFSIERCTRLWLRQIEAAASSQV